MHLPATLDGRAAAGLGARRGPERGLLQSGGLARGPCRAARAGAPGPRRTRVQLWATRTKPPCGDVQAPAAQPEPRGAGTDRSGNELKTDKYGKSQSRTLHISFVTKSRFSKPETKNGKGKRGHSECVAPTCPLRLRASRCACPCAPGRPRTRGERCPQRAPAPGPRRPRGRTRARGHNGRRADPALTSLAMLPDPRRRRCPGSPSAEENGFFW